MNDPYRPPIASPDGNVSPLPQVAPVRGDWSTAPKIVKSWAYQLSWLGIVILPLVILFALLGSPAPLAQRIGTALFYSFLLGLDIWINRGLKKGSRAAWIGQIVLSGFGLLGFPIGTLIHAYVLSQWFKPETKAWFDQP